MRFGKLTGTEAEISLIKELDLCLENKRGKAAELELIREPGKGFLLEYQKKEKKVRIHYQEVNALCRAYLLASSAEYTEDYSIRQECGFADFGLMLDCSRNAVPTLTALKKCIRYAALMGYDFIGLYTEDTMEVTGEPYLGYMRGRLSAGEIREADQYAHWMGMELRPYIQTLAHMNQILRYREYRKITDTDDILLMKDERTLQLLDHILQTVSEIYQTDCVNIGMDEAEMVGLGKFLQIHGYQERQALMREHLEEILKLCRKYNLRPQMWSDMFFKLAFDGEYYLSEMPDTGKVREKLSEIHIPEEAELVYWDYYHTDEADYDRMLEAHQMLTDHIAFAGGAWKWSGFAPHNRYSIRIGQAALTACWKRNVRSVVITCWGDNGAEADLFSVLPSLFLDAQLAWGEENLPGYNEFETLTGLSLEEFLCLDDINPDPSEGMYHNNASKYLLYNDPLYGIFDSLVEDSLIEKLRDTQKRLEELAEKDSPFRYLFETESALCQVLKHKADLGVRIKKYYDEKNRKMLEYIADKELPQMIFDLDYFYQKLRVQWLLNSKPFGLEVQTVRIGGLRQRLLDVSDVLCEYLAGDIRVIEELEAERLPFNYGDGTISDLDFNIWSVNVSPSCI